MTNDKSDTIPADFDDKIRCWVCDRLQDGQALDTGGACPDSAGFCSGCNTELDEHGLPALLCGECGSCRYLRANDRYTATATARRALRKKAQKKKRSALAQQTLPLDTPPQTLKYQGE